MSKPLLLGPHHHQDHIRLVDIQSDEFNTTHEQREFETMMGLLHVKDSLGSWYIGMEASRALYAVLGYRRLVWLSCLPGLKGGA